MRDGLRDVAIRVCPLDWTRRARLRPKPEEQPVMSHVSGLLGVVNVVGGFAIPRVNSDLSDLDFFGLMGLRVSKVRECGISMNLGLKRPV